MAKKKSIFRRIFNVFLVLLVLLVIAVGAVVACVHFEVIERSDVDEKIQMANELVGLYKLPVVGYGGMFQYFEVPEGVEWPPPPEPEPEPEPMEVATPAPTTTITNDRKSKDVKVSRKELDAQIAAREAEEKKRITKLARIYDNMKPEEAAKALDGVNLNMVALILQRMDESNAGQILAKMDPLQAAQITQMMFDGNQRRL